MSRSSHRADRERERALRLRRLAQVPRQQPSGLLVLLLQHADKPTRGQSGSRQSTASAPCAASSSFARENGREPKKPRLADSGDGCADSMIGVAAQHRAQVRGIPPPQDRDERTAARDEGADRVLGDLLPPPAAMGCRQPGRDGEHSVEQHDALIAPRREVAVRGARDAEIGVELLVDVREAPRERTHVPRRRRTTARSDAPASGTDPGPTMSTRTSASGRWKARSTTSPAGR